MRTALAENSRQSLRAEHTKCSGKIDMASAIGFDTDDFDALCNKAHFGVLRSASRRYDHRRMFACCGHEMR